MKLYQQLARTLQAYDTSHERCNVEWVRRHYNRLIELCREHLPSGAGIDSGVQLNIDESTPEKLVLDFGFHPMNEYGYYESWIDCKAIVTPSLSFGFDLAVEGNLDDCGLDDYLHETLQAALDVEIPEAGSIVTDKGEYTQASPEDLDEAAQRVKKVREQLLLDWDESGAAPLVTQHWLYALALLEQAQCQLNMASYRQAPAITKRTPSVRGE